MIQLHEFVFNDLLKVLNHSEILVYLRLTQLCGAGRECQQSQKQLAEALEMSGPATSHAVNSLIKRGLLVVTKAKSRNYAAKYFVKRFPTDQLGVIVSPHENIDFEQMTPEHFKNVKDKLFDMLLLRWKKRNDGFKMFKLLSEHFGELNWGYNQTNDFFRAKVWQQFENAVTDKELVRIFHEATQDPEWNLDSWFEAGLP